MKILFFITRGDTIGGAQTHVLILANSLLKNGNQVLVCLGGVHSVFCDILENNQIPFVNIKEFDNSINLISDFKSLYSLKDIVNKFSPDILSVHSTKANYLARMLNINKKYTLISTIHGWSFTDGTPFLFKYINLFVEKLTSKLSSGFILVCKHDYELGKKHNIINNNYKVIYNGVPDLYQEKSNDFGSMIIVMVARFDKQKNQFKLIKSTYNIPNVIVEFVGDGPNLEYCKNYVSKLNISDKYVFHGSSNNVKNILLKADIFALISNWEGFPMSTIEAMSLKLPILVSDVGGAGECVINGFNGYKVHTNISVSELENTVLFMISENQNLSKMGENSRKLYLENFTDYIMIEQTYLYFKKFLK